MHTDKRAFRNLAWSACAVFGAVSLGACGGGGTTPATTVTQTVIRETVTVSPSSTPAPPPAPAKPAPSTPDAAVAASPEAVPAPELFVMPKLVGVNLQLAQDTLQSVGSYVLDQEDASGLGRIQVNDSNWKVCSQRPKAGASVPIETVVLLTSVKLAEECP